MTENEAKAIRFIEYIKNYAVETLDHIDKGDAIASTVTHMGKKEKAETILAMVEELKKYRAIGTPEEFQALKDRLIAKKVSLRHVRKFDGFDEGECPTCGKSVSREFDGADIFCPDCGQKLDWSDEE